jgi:hypothetical protein
MAISRSGTTLAGDRRIFGRGNLTRKGALALAAVLTLLSASFVAGCGRPAREPTATPTAVAVTASVSAGATAADRAAPSPTPTSPPPAMASPRTPLDDLLDQIERRVEEIRGLSSTVGTRRRFVDSATLAGEIERHLEKPEAKAQLAREQLLYRLLGLIGPGDDLGGLYRDLLGSQVLGLYDDEADEFWVLHGGEELSALAETTYAHEYVHRLQDLRFDLGALGDAAEGNSDRELALSALVEGDAVVTQLGYGLRYMNRTRLTELARSAAELGPPPAETPFVLVSALEFPYTAGPTLVGVLRGNSGGFEAVNRAFGAPPTSTEQVLHPEKYRAGEAPVDVDLPDLAAALGDGWAPQPEDVLGEFLLKTWLAALGRIDAASAAAGWGGDRYRVWTDLDGQAALAARIVWDRPEEDGQEFFESLAAGLDRSSSLRRVGSTGGRRAVWQGDGRAIGVELLPGGRGTVVAAAPRAVQVEGLLEAAARP